ncbi:MAG: alpha-galactosidase [Bryobacteraceae bacterium]
MLLLLLGIACPAQTWRLESGSVEYRLRQDNGSILIDYFGPVGGAPWKDVRRLDIAGTLEGRALRPGDLILASASAPDARSLQLVYRVTRASLEIEARYAAMGDTGVITRRLTLANTGTAPIRVRMDSLALELPPGEYDLSYLWGGWGRERQLATEPLGPGRRDFISRRGRSTNGYASWFSLHNKTLGVRYAAELAYSGNWEMSFERYPGSAPLAADNLDARMGMRFDSGGVLTLAPGRRFELPAVAMTASAGSLDDAANHLHRYQREFVMARNPANQPPLVQFNSWYPFQGKLTIADTKRLADAAAGIGAEVFVLDAGWYNQKDWSRELGDYEADPVGFPGGLAELGAYVRSKGMKFGIWTEIENLGTGSETFRQHPDWCLAGDGHPLLSGDRCQMDFAKPEVRAWARAVLDRLVREAGIGWVKIDFNIDIGDEVDSAAGDRLYNHVMAYYAWLDELRAAYPNLIVENCSSGGLRFDLGIIAHTNTTWLSDQVLPKPSVQLAYGCTIEFAPQVCNHWMVGDKDNGEVVLSNPPGWWDFLFRVPMNGQFGISSRVFDWSPPLRLRAAENVALYKRLRTEMMRADVYHLTPSPDHDEPEGWMALEYAAPERDRAIVMAYRLGQSAETKILKLFGLDPQREYAIQADGHSLGTRSGRELSGGFTVQADAEWRAVVYEFQAVR